MTASPLSQADQKKIGELRAWLKSQQWSLMPEDISFLLSLVDKLTTENADLRKGYEQQIVHQRAQILEYRDILAEENDEHDPPDPSTPSDDE